MLIQVGKLNDGVIKEGPKCEHKTQGQWVVLKAQKVYVFDPPTQMQKDFWLSEVKPGKWKEKRIAMLRWFCNLCGTVQEP